MAWRRWLVAIGLVGGCGPQVDVEAPADTDSAEEESGTQPQRCDPFQGDRVVGFTTVEADAPQTQIGLTSGHVVVFAGESIYAVPRCGGRMERVGDAAGTPENLTADGPNLLWSERGTVFETDPVRGYTRTLARFEGAVAAIAPGIDDVFVGVYFAREDSGLHALPRDGSSSDHRWAATVGERIRNVVTVDEQTYMLVVEEELAGPVTRVVSIDGTVMDGLQGDGTIEQLAARAGAFVMVRDSGEPDFRTSVEARSRDDGRLLWELDGLDAPELLITHSPGLCAFDGGSPTRLLEIPGPQPPFELTRIAFGPGVPVRNFGVGLDLAFDAAAAYWVDVTRGDGPDYDIIVTGRGLQR